MGKLDNDNIEFPDHTREYEGLIPYFWCEENDIVVNPEYHYVNGDSQWRIGITIKGKRNLDPKIYDKKDIMEKVYKYCEYYYNKYSNKELEAIRKHRKPIWGDIYDPRKRKKI